MAQMVHLTIFVKYSIFKGGGTNVAGLPIHIHYSRIRIRIQDSQKKLDLDSDPGSVFSCSEGHILKKKFSLIFVSLELVIRYGTQCFFSFKKINLNRWKQYYFWICSSPPEKTSSFSVFCNFFEGFEISSLILVCTHIGFCIRLIANFAYKRAENGKKTQTRILPKLLQQPWVQSQHPLIQWNLRGGRWRSVE